MSEQDRERPDDAAARDKPPEAAQDRPRPGVAGDAQGFVRSLFDLSFSSFVTPKVIKVLYLLVMIGTLLSALLFTIAAFRSSAGLGLLTLFILAPLYSLIVLALWRILLEAFMVVFRIADDIRAIRDRS